MSIISCSGSIGSGKNALASAIQWVQIQNVNPELPKPAYGTFEEMVKRPKDINALSQWKTKSFASHLKTIASLILGVPVEQFESQEFKNKTLGQLVKEGYVSKECLDILT